MNEDKASHYHRLGRRADVLSLAVNAAILAALALTPGASWLGDALMRLASGMHAPPELSRVAVPCVLAVLLTAGVEIALLPLSFVRGFALERRFGLSREHPRSWLRDHLTGAALRLGMIAAAATVAYGSMAVWPRAWWFVSAAVFSLGTLCLTQLAPVAVLPIFFRLKPLERDGLRARLGHLAQRAGTRVMGIYEWGLGDKTRKANAALVGISRTRRILVSDTLLREYSDDEIEVILAHELAHHVNRDIWKSLAYDGALTMGGLLLADVALRVAGPTLGLTGIGDPAGLPLLALALAGLGVVLTPVANAFSRSHERRADRYALDMTRNPEAFVSAMRRMGAQNLAEERPSRLVELLFYTHPPMRDRIAAARRWREGTTIANLMQVNGRSAS